MSDKLEDMRFEIQKHEAAHDEKQMVTWMKSGLKLGLTGIEVANTRYGPFLSLEGWADNVTEDMSKFEMPLGRLYRKYWTQSTMSPEMELAWVILSSMGMYHMQKKGAGFLASYMNSGASDASASFGQFAAQSSGPPVTEGLPPEGPSGAPSPGQRTMAPPAF
jgi:hypothetical protein